jgi:hypothetical protein
MIRKLGLISAVGALALAVVGCDDDDPAPAAAAAPFLSGTAAVGAAMANSPVVVNCAGTTTNFNVTTDANGNYSVTATAAADAGATLPCAIQVTYSSADYFSLLQSGAVANVTPLTTLVVARALSLAGVAGTPSAWFSGGADLTTVTSTHVTNAASALTTALQSAAGGETISFDLFSGTLSPGNANDPYDVWLDSFNDAVANYNTFLTTFSTNGTIPTITITLPEIENGGTLTANICVTTNGVPFCTNTVTQNTPFPAGQADFCAGYGGNLSVPGLGSFTCSFSNNTGRLTGSVVTPAVVVNGISLPGQTVSYDYTYTWSAN